MSEKFSTMQEISCLSMREIAAGITKMDTFVLFRQCKRVTLRPEDVTAIKIGVICH